MLEFGSQMTTLELTQVIDVEDEPGEVAVALSSDVLSPISIEEVETSDTLNHQPATQPEIEIDQSDQNNSDNSEASTVTTLAVCTDSAVFFPYEFREVSIRYTNGALQLPLDWLRHKEYEPISPVVNPLPRPASEAEIVSKLDEHNYLQTTLMRDFPWLVESIDKLYLQHTAGGFRELLENSYGKNTAESVHSAKVVTVEAG